jgi:hypothetical protein
MLLKCQTFSFRNANRHSQMKRSSNGRLLLPSSLLLSSFLQIPLLFPSLLQIPLLPSSLLQILIPSGAFKLVANLGVVIVVVELVANLGAIIVAFKLATNLVVANFGVFSSLLQWIQYLTTSRYDNPIPLEIIIMHKICDHDFEAL